MTMLDVLKTRLPKGLSIIKEKEMSSKYIITFQYEEQIVKAELRKCTAPKMENKNCDFTICTAMSSIFINKKDLAKAKEWLDKIC